MPVGNNGLLEGIKQIPGRLRALDILGGLPGAPLGFRMRGALQSGPPTTGTWKAGDEVRDRNGCLWICVTGGTPGTWKGSLAGLAPTGDVTGAKDVANIQGLLNLVGWARLQAGLFYINQTLLASSGTVLSGAGKGLTTVKAASGSWSSQTQIGSYTGLGMLQIAGEASVSSIEVRGITWDGNQTGITALPSWIGNTYQCSPLMLWNVTGLTIEDCQVVNSVGYGMWCASVTDFHIERNTVTTGQVTAAQGWGTPAQQDGIHLTSVAYGTVCDNTIDTGTSTTDTGDDGIAIQSFAVCHDITISGNSIRSGEAGIDLALSGADIYDISITGNNIWSTQENGIVSQPFTVSSAVSRNIAVTGNTIASASQNGHGANGISFWDYSIISTPAAGFENVTVTGNTIENITNTNAAGIYFAYGSRITVTGNTIRNFAGYGGVQVGNNVSGTSTPASDFVVSGNIIDVSAQASGTGGAGINVKDSNTGTLSNNVILGPGPDGSGSTGIGIGSFGATVQAVTMIANTLNGWDYGIQEYNAGANPDYNSYTGNIFTSCTQNLDLVGTHNQLMLPEQFTVLSSSYTLTSSTSLQKLFNASTAGTVTLQPGLYFFECELDLSSMSTSSGAFSFGFGGTATIASLKYRSEAIKGTTPGTAQIVTGTAATATALVSASTTATGSALIKGTIRVSAAGTLIPQVALGVAAAAVVGTNSWFRIRQAATSSSVTTSGNWS